MFICDISVFNRFGKRSLDIQLSPLGLDWQGLVAILVIDQVSGISQKRLNPFLQTDKSNVSKLITALENANLIYREKEKGDLRNKSCYLTEKGKALVPQLQKILDAWEESLVRNISEKDLAVFKRVNAIITQNLVPNGEDFGE